jgi:hypothetical protein
MSCTGGEMLFIGNLPKTSDLKKELATPYGIVVYTMGPSQ